MPPEVDPRTARFAVDRATDDKQRRPDDRHHARRPRPRWLLPAVVVGVLALVVGVGVGVMAATGGSDQGASGAPVDSTDSTERVAETAVIPTTTTTVADLVELSTAALPLLFDHFPSGLDGSELPDETVTTTLLVTCRPAGCELTYAGTTFPEVDGRFSGTVEGAAPTYSPACLPIVQRVDIAILDSQVVDGLSVPSRIVGQVSTRMETGTLQQGITTYECTGYQYLGDIDAILFPT